MTMIHIAGSPRARVLSPPETPRIKQAHGVRARCECDRLGGHTRIIMALASQRFGAVGRCRPRPRHPSDGSDGPARR